MIKYSVNSEIFQKELSPSSPFEMDYAFFFADLLEAIDGNKKVNIIPYSPYGNAFTGRVKDASYDKLSEKIILEFVDEKDFSFYLSKTEIKQPSSAKYNVNSENYQQELNFTFIK